VRIVITGGAGCLGSNLIEHWLPAGHEILVIDNFATGKREVLPPKAGLQLIEGSVGDGALVDRAFADFRPTHVVHCAASYKEPDNWREDATTNMIGSINIARAAEAQGVKRLINLQTALCYGRPQRVPIPIDAPVAPFTSYGVSKACGEMYIRMARVPTVSLRLANITGPRLAIGPIPTFYKRLKAGQKCFCSDTVRDFLDMEDFISLMDLAVCDGAPTGMFNVSTGEGRSIKDVFDAVARYLALTPAEPPPIIPPGTDDVAQVVLDPSVTEQAFGWKARFEFAATIDRQLAWYDRHGVTDIYSHLSTPPSSKS
jgi:UDP-glucose 4-epimerase